MATYAWLSNAVRRELLGAAACQTHTPNYQFLLVFDSLVDISLIVAH